MSEKGAGIEPGAIDATTLTGAASAAYRYLRWEGSSCVVTPPTDERELRGFHSALNTIFALCTSVPLSSVGAPLGPIITTVIAKPEGGEPTPVEIRIPGPIDAYRAYAATVGLFADSPPPAAA